MNRLPLLTAALLGSALSVFRPYEGTNAGGILYVCATPQATAPVNAAAYAALTWVKVSSVGAVGEMGVQTNILSYDTWDDDVVRKQKGMSNAGDPTVEVARISNDPGQVILRAQAKTKLRYAFKIERDDETVPGNAGTIIYNWGLVTGPTRPMGRNEDFDLEVFTLALMALEIVVESVVGNLPNNTALPTITGTPKVATVMTVANGTWTGDATITYAYQWRLNGVPVPGANANTYTPVVGDIGKFASCVVTATNPAGSMSAATAPTIAIVA